VARIAAVVALLAFIACGAWLLALDGHVIRSSIDGAAASNPLRKAVVLERGAWLAHHASHPATLALPALALLGLLGVALLRRPLHAFIAGGVAVACIVLTAGAALFPFLLPSATNPAHGLTVWDASSSRTTLGLMLVATALLLPVVLAYSSWAFRVMRGE